MRKTILRRYDDAYLWLQQKHRRPAFFNIKHQFDVIVRNQQVGHRNKIFEIIKTLVRTDKLRSMLERNDIPII
jgi:hypothetical protein